MNILLTTTQAWFLYIGIIVGVILILGVVFYFTCGFRFKRDNKTQVNHVIVDDNFINTLLIGLGGKDNIKTLSIDNGRVKFNVLDLDLINQDAIREVSTTGAFITGSNVKLLFKYDSAVIVETLKERGIC